MSHTKDTLVQQTTAGHLDQQLGWKSVFAWNSVVFGLCSVMGGDTARMRHE